MEDNEESEILSQALPVAKLPENFDFSIAPVTGEDYLSRVRLEASKNPIVIAKNIDLKKFEKNRTSLIYQSEFNNENRKEFKSTRDWQCQKSAEFSRLRDKCAKEKNQFLKKYPFDKKAFNLSSLKSKKDWFSFCYGKRASKKETESDSNLNEEMDKGNEPCLSILYNLDQTSIVKLFDYQVEWLSSNGYSRKIFEWIFCLMCFLEKPLLPETHSSLRDLARECLKMRNELTDPSDDKLNELNLFIALVGRYFQQTDLADQDD